MASPQRSKILDAIALTLTGVSVIGVSIRWTVKDGLPFAANLFYALPFVVIAGFLVVAAVIWLKNDRRALSAGCAIAAVIAGGLWWHGTYYGGACEARSDGLRILTWNTARGFGGWPKVGDYVSAENPDLVGLVEAGGSSDEWREFWAEHLPEHEIYLAGGGLVILARGEIVEEHVFLIGGASTCAEVVIDFEGQRIRVLLVDAVVRPFSNRRDLVEKVFELARAKPELPTVVMGDFNTPIDSVWFDGARRDFVHAFEKAGRGLLTTWPLPLPMLAIDHVWVSRRLRVDCASIGWTWISDHRPIVADVRLTNSPGP
jgi:endonuclease/exonuclease/phosphatase (EEP) superfamily protein YafD